MEWTQLSLFDDPDRVVEITVHIGIVGGHAQWQVEVWNPVERVLLGMSSAHHRPTHDWDRWIGQVNEELIAALAQLTSPFPF